MALFPTNNLYPMKIGGITLPVEPSQIEIRQTRDYEITDVPLRDGTVKQFLGVKDIEITINAHIDPLPVAKEERLQAWVDGQGLYDTDFNNAFKLVLDMFQNSETGVLPISSTLTDLVHVKWVCLKDFQTTSAGGRSRSMLPYTMTMISDDGGTLESLFFVDTTGAHVGRMRAMQRAARRSMAPMTTEGNPAPEALTAEQWAAKTWGSSKLGKAIRQKNQAHLKQVQKDRSLGTVNKILSNLGYTKPTFIFRAQSAVGTAHATADPLGDGPWITYGSTSVFTPSHEKDTIFGIMDAGYGRGSGGVNEVLATNPHILNPMDISGDTVRLPPLSTAQARGETKDFRQAAVALEMMGEGVTRTLQGSSTTESWTADP